MTVLNTKRTYYLGIAILIGFSFLAMYCFPANEDIQAKEPTVSKISQSRGISYMPKAEVTLPKDPGWSDIAKKIVDEFESEGKKATYEALIIAYHESGWREEATGKNKDKVKSTDRGVFQINNVWHGEVDHKCAYNFECNIREAKRIFKNNGKNWNQWTTRKYLK